MFRNLKLPPEFKALEDLLRGKTLMAGAYTAAALAVIGVTTSLIQAGKQKRLQETAADEAAKAIARARQAVTKNVALERAIPTITMDSMLKATAQQQKQALDALQTSGQRAVIGGVPAVGVASEKVMEKIRGDAEKELLAREDLVTAQQIAQEQQQLNLIAAEGTGARMQEARAAQARATAISGAVKSAAKGAAAIAGNEDIIKLFGTEERQYRKGIDKLLEGTPEFVDIDREGFEEYLNTVKVDDGSGNMVPATQDQVIEMLNNPENTLIQDFMKYSGDQTDLLTPKIEVPLTPPVLDS